MDDVHTWDLSVGHILSGPIAVDGAEPGDILEVELLDVQPHPDMPWGYTAILPEANGGGGFLGDQFKKPAKAIWDFEGIYATSRHIPGVKFVGMLEFDILIAIHYTPDALDYAKLQFYTGMIHPGIVCTAPSKELLNEWNRREGELVASGGKKGTNSNLFSTCISQKPFIH